MENPLNISVNPIIINDIRDIQTDGKFVFQIPEDDVFYTVNPEHIRFEDEDNYYYQGIVHDDKNRYSGMISFSKYIGNYYAEINVNNRSFVIHDLDEYHGVSFNNKFQFLVEKSSILLDKIYCNTHTTAEIEIDSTLIVKGSDQLVQYRTICPKRVRVLILYTNSAQSIVGNIQNHAITMISQVNDALANSLMQQQDLRFVLARAQVYSSVNENNFSDLGLRGHINSGLNSVINAIRITNKADIVVLIHNKNPMEGYGIADGVFTLASFIRNNGHAVVHVNHTGRYTFAHEVAHLLGARHDNEITGVTSDYQARGKILSDCNSVRTIMAEIPSGSTSNRIPYFSNPNVFVPNMYCGGDSGPSPNQDWRTGTFNSRDNFKIMKMRAPLVANYEQGGDQFSISISGPQVIYDNFTYSWCGIASCHSNESLNYQWSWSPNGFTYYNIANTDCISLTPSYFNVSNTNITLKLVATGIAHTATSFMTVFVSTSIAARPTKYFTNHNILTNYSLNRFNVFPNPSNQIANINVELSQDSYLSIDIYNNLGFWEKTITSNQLFSKGNHIINIELDNRLQSYKIIRINDGNNIESLPLITK